MDKPNRPVELARVPTGVKNFDAILSGGLPFGTLTLLGGPPGSGKTTLTHQICFHNASPENKVLIFQTLSEPTAKILRYLQTFSFYDHKKLEDGSIELVDLGGIMRGNGLQLASEKIIEHLKRVRPTFVVIDGFKVFNDLAGDNEQLRKFSYEVAINLMAWECTSFLLGEFTTDELKVNPLSSVVDSIIIMDARETYGEPQRFIKVTKLRGTDHARDSFPMVITRDGVEIYTPRITIQNDHTAYNQSSDERRKTGIASLDQLLGNGIQTGSSILLCGTAGTGKTLLALEWLYRGAKDFNEKGIFFSFEESEQRLISVSKNLGWDLQKEIQNGNIEIVVIPQPDILIERDLLLIQNRIKKLKPKRIAIDSASVFLHKLTDQIDARDKMYQLATLVQKNNAIGLFATNIPYGSSRISRFGVEENVVDGIILLTSTEIGLDRERHIEIYKLRNTNHAYGRHPMRISSTGINISPRFVMSSDIEKEK